MRIDEPHINVRCSSQSYQCWKCEITSCLGNKRCRPLGCFDSFHCPLRETTLLLFCFNQEKAFKENRKAYWGKKCLGFYFYMCVRSRLIISFGGKKCSVNGIEIDVSVITYSSLGQCLTSKCKGGHKRSLIHSQPIEIQLPQKHQQQV